jgi:hypothetical protein
VTVDVRIFGWVAVTDVAEDSSNQQILKDRKEKTGYQSDSVTM